MSSPRCWNCETALDEAPSRNPFCSTCGRLNPLPAGTTLFQVMELPRSVDVPLEALEKRFREKSLLLHPDRFAQSDARERRFSAEHTTSLNEALKTLKDEPRRYFYLLKLHGLDLTREDAGTQKDLPLEFLEEVMERREALDAARSAKDLMRAQGMAEDVKRSLRQALDAARAALTTLEQGPDAAAMKAAAYALSRVRYFQRFLEEVDAMEEELLS